MVSYRAWYLIGYKQTDKQTPRQANLYIEIRKTFKQLVSKCTNDRLFMSKVYFPSTFSKQQEYIAPPPYHNFFIIFNILTKYLFISLKNYEISLIQWISPYNKNCVSVSPTHLHNLYNFCLVLFYFNLDCVNGST